SVPHQRHILAIQDEYPEYVAYGAAPHARRKRIAPTLFLTRGFSNVRKVPSAFRHNQLVAVSMAFAYF
ncbi:MAG: hypothetical protein L0L41_00885, partial [Acetobacter sp.]|nr:hypothetical protein [Acetobacter sp.]